MALETLGSSESFVYIRGFPESRYRTVEPFVREAFDTRRYPFYQDIVYVADIGGFQNNKVVQKVFGDLRTISLNIPWEYHNPPRIGDVVYDGLSMPLASDSIPVVMAVDVLEQVHPSNRFQLINEMVRVAQERAVVSCPFHSISNAVSEEGLLDSMKEIGLPEKTSFRIHRKLGLPTLGELVAMGRKTGFPFQLWPATDRRMDFNGLNHQIEILKTENGKSPTREQVDAAEQFAQLYDLSLRESSVGQRPAWDNAYRAVFFIDKQIPGVVLTRNEDYIYSSNESTAYELALAKAWYEGHYQVPNMVRAIIHGKENFLHEEEKALRGFNIAFEGPDGVGKTETLKMVADKLAAWGYSVATPMRYGPRQKLREWERAYGVLPEPAREALLVDTTNQSVIAANAHKLLGPCCIGLSDRTLASTTVYHEIHGIQRPVEFVLQNTHRIPPDLTIILEVDDFEANWHRKGAKGDPANAQITREQLAKQRQLYKEMKENSFTGPILRIKSNGSVEETSELVLDAIEKHLGLPTRRIKPAQQEEPEVR